MTAKSERNINSSRKKKWNKEMKKGKTGRNKKREEKEMKQMSSSKKKKRENGRENKRDI